MSTTSAVVTNLCRYWAVEKGISFHDQTESDLNVNCYLFSHQMSIPRLGCEKPCAGTIERAFLSEADSINHCIFRGVVFASNCWHLPVGGNCITLQLCSYVRKWKEYTGSMFPEVVREIDISILFFHASGFFFMHLWYLSSPAMPSHFYFGLLPLLLDFFLCSL